MIYLVYFDKGGEFADRISKEEIIQYRSIKYFLPLLEQKGLVVHLTDREGTQVNAVSQLINYVNEHCVYLCFSKPDQEYFGIKYPKVFISDLDYPNQVNKLTQTKKIIAQSLGGIVEGTNTFNLLKPMVLNNFLLTKILPPVWEKIRAIKVTENFMTIDGELLDTDIKRFLPKSKRVPLKLKFTVDDIFKVAMERDKIAPFLDTIHRRIFRRYNHYYYPTKIHFDGIIYTAIITKSSSKAYYQQLMEDFCSVFNDKADATLVIKFTDLKSKNERAAILKWLQQQSIQCRIIVLYAHLPQPKYETLVMNTTFYINTSPKKLTTSILEFMSASKPIISPKFDILEDFDKLIFEVSTTKKSYKAALLESYSLIKNDQSKYEQIAQSTSETIKNHCSEEVVAPKFFDFLNQIETLIGQNSSKNAL